MRFQVLGPVRGWCGPTELDLGTPKQREMLAALLLAGGRPLSTEQLIDSIWGEAAPSAPERSLWVYAARLRRAFGDAAGALTSLNRGYRLDLAPGQLDLTAFEEIVANARQARAAGNSVAAVRLWDQALALSQAQPLLGLGSPGVLAARERLTERLHAVREDRFEALLTVGRPTEIIDELTAHCRAHPLRERPHALRMLALYRCGRQSEALDVYTRTRRVLNDELGVEPGPDLHAAQQQILNAGHSGKPAIALLNHSVQDRLMPPWPQPLPAQLPADVSDFIGRETLVARLERYLDNRADRPGLLVMTGMAGIGKTTLAVHLAHRARDRHPDGQLFVELGGTDGRPVEPDAVLGSLLRAIGVTEDEIPPNGNARAALWRSLVVDKRLLLVLDDARDAEQVRQLLPGTPTATVLVTSRASMVGLLGAHLAPLDVLTPEESLGLLRSMAGADRIAAELPAARHIVAACGRLPLALRIMGTRLAARPLWSMAVVAQRLADERRRLSELTVGDVTIESTFRYSYHQLGPETARAFVLLAIPAVTDLSARAAAAVLKREPDVAEKICEQLVDLGLLQSPVPGRYRYHDLLRLFASELSAEVGSERMQVLPRLLEFLLASAKNVAAMHNPGQPICYLTSTSVPGERPADRHEALAWFAAERATMLALHRQVVATEPELAPLCVDLAMVCAVCVDASEQLPQLVGVVRALADMAMERGDRRTWARGQVAMGVFRQLGLGEFDVLDEIGEAARILHELGEVVPALTADDVMASAAAHQGRFELAEYHHRAGIARIREIGGSDAGEATARVGLAGSYCLARWVVDAVDAAERGDCAGSACRRWRTGGAGTARTRLRDHVARRRSGCRDPDRRGRNRGVDR
jgi:DNA-binding SARP family transcriptional activator